MDAANGVKAAGLPASGDDPVVVNLISDDEDDASAGSQTNTNENWETASMYDDIIEVEEIANDEFLGGENSCSAEEARAYRERLLEIGPEKFILETVTAKRVTAKKLCTAFRIRAPSCFEGAEDSAYYPLLGVLITRELNQRRSLPQYKTIDDAAKLLQSSNKIMVITGAGISTSLGIPDFRSKNTGFYSRLQELGFSDPEEVFDIRTFDEDPTIFYTLARDIIPDLNKWSPTHEFIHLLQKQGKLLTNYTQNIDNIESHAGIDPQKLVQCHGSWATATCRKCQHKVPGESLFGDVKAQRVSKCKRCERELQVPRPGQTKRKRSSNGSSKSRKRRQSEDDDDDSDGQYDIPEPGVMKPDVTFFGEGLPKHFFDRLRKEDREAVDLVIVIGTSMKVAPVSEIPHILPRHVPQIYISREPVRHIDFDVNLLGQCDTVVAELCRRAGWELEHEMLPKNLEVDVILSETDDNVSVVKLRDESAPKEAKL